MTGSNQPPSYHDPVLLRETLQCLRVSPDATLIDCTAGDAGHTIGFLNAAGPESRALAIDRDAVALDRCQTRLRGLGLDGQVTLVHGDFADLEQVAASQGFLPADNVLMDLGFSSSQIDCPCRGFSFLQQGPLDMRMDQSQKRTAADFVNKSSREELEDLFRRWGEEPQARRLAAAIVRERPFEDTLSLALTVQRVRRPERGSRLHPATRVFQALRLAVNRELEQLRSALPQALTSLRSGGSLCVISFHSLEDREVKVFLRRHCDSRARNKYVAESRQRRPSVAPLALLHRRAVQVSDAERAANPRSRSARLRAAVRTEAAL